MQLLHDSLVQRHIASLCIMCVLECIYDLLSNNQTFWWGLIDNAAEEIKSLVTHSALPSTMWYKVLEGESFGKIVHTIKWQIIFWQMPKIAKASKIIISYVLTFYWSFGIIEYSHGMWLRWNILPHTNKYLAS